MSDSIINIDMVKNDANIIDFKISKGPGPLTRVCIFESMFAFFVYIHMEYSKESETLFVFSDALDKDAIAKLVSNYIYFSKKTFTRLDFYLSKLDVFSSRVRRYRKMLCLERMDVYAQDHINISLMVRSFNKVILEDGLANYINRPNSTFLNYTPFGFDKSVDNIYLSGRTTVPDAISNKVTLFDMVGFSKDGFNIISTSEEDSDNADILILTQPFSEDGHILESEKIKIYKEICELYFDQGCSVTIKSHPRESTQYESHIEDIHVMDKNYPIEVMISENSKFKEIVSISSSSSLNLSKINTLVSIVILGSEKYSSFKNAYGYVGSVLPRSSVIYKSIANV